MRPIRRILIANRGEIACRIARSARAMGIATVAVFSDVDASALHLAACDEAVRIGPPPARESYLSIERLVAAARATGCDAVHPGYGFLSENAAFARACADAGLVFIGPPADVIHLLGSKERARERAERAGVPVLRSHPADADPGTLQYPVLLKASAGGGGKGMRIVRAAQDLPDALAAARREAAAAFGDDTILIERYLEGARHVEIQIFGDAHGNLVHLFERECSIQRRHQKIIEETPSPAVSPALRDAMTGAAVRLAREVGYQNAGTVEMLLAPDGSFTFLEVNTRLQVEHPVTEATTGIDLVREQIRVAEGHPLSFRQEDLRQTGHAIECRLYAEDPSREFLPAGGRIAAWQTPSLPGLRVDSGVAAGDEVPIEYDPLLAKIVCHASGRDEAVLRLARVLEDLVALGVTTNRGLLVAALRHPAFAAGQLDTHFLETHAGDLFGPPPEGVVERAALAAALARLTTQVASRAVLPDLSLGWRNNRGDDEVVRLRVGDRSIEVRHRALGGGRFDCRVDGQEHSVVFRRDGDQVSLEDGAGVVRRFRVVLGEGRVLVATGAVDVALVEEPRFASGEAAQDQAGLTAPMPSRVVKVLVDEGDTCAAGQALIILEAMKMEHPVRAARAGRVRRLYVGEGDPVEAGAPLVAIDPL